MKINKGKSLDVTWRWSHASAALNQPGNQKGHGGWPVHPENAVMNDLWTSDILSEN